MNNEGQSGGISFSFRGRASELARAFLVGEDWAARDGRPTRVCGDMSNGNCGR
jgi:hypothetical protein